MVESLKLKGALTAILVRKDGSTQTVAQHNAIMNVGFDFIADAIGSPTSRPNIMQMIAVGTGSSTVSPAQTALDNQLAIKQATYSHSSLTKVFTLTTTFNPGEATGPITEAGVFNADRGVMFDRVAFSVINKGPDDTLKMTFTFTLS